MEWRKIESAPRDGTPIRLKCEPRPEFGEHLMWWEPEAERWAGYALALACRVDTWWDEAAEQPTHWAPA